MPLGVRLNFFQWIHSLNVTRFVSLHTPLERIEKKKKVSLRSPYLSFALEDMNPAGE